MNESLALNSSSFIVPRSSFLQSFLYTQSADAHIMAARRQRMCGSSGRIGSLLIEQEGFCS
jgi:hypothetical protein